LVAEIQVRTILQHAWAEIEHDTRYKAVDVAPTAIARRFVALAGLLEIADREFQALQDSYKPLASSRPTPMVDDSDQFGPGCDPYLRLQPRSHAGHINSNEGTLERFGMNGEFSISQTNPPMLPR
jgi:hypothetical protein